MGTILGVVLWKFLGKGKKIIFRNNFRDNFKDTLGIYLRLSGTFFLSILGIISGQFLDNYVRLVNYVTTYGAE